MKHKTRTIVKAIIVFPGNVLVVIPGLLLYLEGGINPGWGLGWTIILVGGIFACFGILMAAHSARLFLRFGEGTPAPWEPPQKLVVKGAYRHVRNPMLIGVLSVLLGMSLILGSAYILIWAAVFFLLNNLYLIFFEEPGLQRRFGEQYFQYKREVPRWLPRLRPYE